MAETKRTITKASMETTWESMEAVKNYIEEHSTLTDQTTTRTKKATELLPEREVLFTMRNWDTNHSYEKLAEKLVSLGLAPVGYEAGQARAFVEARFQTLVYQQGAEVGALQMQLGGKVSALQARVLELEGRDVIDPKAFALVIQKVEELVKNQARIYAALKAVELGKKFTLDN